MKPKRSTSAHITLNAQLIKQTSPPSPVKNKLQEINDKINQMFIKAKNPNEQVKNIETHLQSQFQSSKILSTISKEKTKLLSQITSKDGKIKEQEYKINELNKENEYLKLQLEKYQQISIEMEQLEQYCSKIVQENQQLKQQVNQLQTSFSFLQSSNLITLGQEIDQQIQSLSKSLSKCFKLLEYSCQKEFDDLQALIKINSSVNSQHKQEGNLYTILKESLEQLKRLIFETDKQFDLNYKKVSSNVFYSYNY
ncbi:unnamed protein product (macronuclear) [Paramecium tetraurelia]|uniref:Uncharacterized protein n=1 Tax=Paramecium tetraurelia TaxID=5888 RepID=A0BV67_PARTE|nr:uncharacterized protein GSPATT00005680001 [Paramecium tetraurelia]CAK62434.1 unnamed protein product [Paramecium tetraurelia]|eukprot:XP_001429832.1 hypothetical protein (macronuclear) [Paramecium tetraurelia strain d4-2]